MRPLRIGSVVLPTNVVLAPLAGVTDCRYRAAVRRLGGCGITYTELVSVEGAVRGQGRTLDLMARAADEKPFGVQLYGYRPEAMAEAARIAADSGADLVDINAGCPAKKVVRSRGGSYLLAEPDTLREILRRVRSAIAIPLTLKFRSGFTDDRLNFMEVGKMAQEEGADAVTLHPRTRSQQFSGHSNWEHIARLKAALGIPVVGNGDVFSPEDARSMMEQTGCDAVMVGRGIMKNPWLIRQVVEGLSTGTWSRETPAERLNLCRELVESVDREHPNQAKRLGHMKKYCNWLVAGFRGSALHRRQLLLSQTPHELMGALSSLADSAGDIELSQEV